MLLPPLDEREPARVMEPGHFENFVGVRLAFTTDTDDAIDGPASTIADVVDSDVERDTAGPLNDLIDGVDGMQRDTDLGDVADITTAANDQEADLIDQQQQPVPVVDPGVTPVAEGGTADVPPVDVEVHPVPLPGTRDPTPEPEP